MSRSAPPPDVTARRRTADRTDPPNQGSPVGRWSIDAGRSTLRVSVRVGLFATVHGTFADINGQVEITSDPMGSRVDATVGTASLSSGHAPLDGLLHSAGLIDSSRNPSISFVSRGVRGGRPPGPGSWTGCWPPTGRSWMSCST